MAWWEIVTADNDFWYWTFLYCFKAPIIQNVIQNATLTLLFTGWLYVAWCFITALMIGHSMFASYFGRFSMELSNDRAYVKGGLGNSCGKGIGADNDRSRPTQGLLYLVQSIWCSCLLISIISLIEGCIVLNTFHYNIIITLRLTVRNAMQIEPI